MPDKWYSNKITAEQAESLKKLYAKLKNVGYSNLDQPPRVRPLHFSLCLEDGYSVTHILNKASDIKQLLTKTHSKKIEELEGKIVEAYVSYRGIRVLEGISVNENLV